MEEQIAETEIKNERLKDLIYFSLAAITLISLLLFAIGFMFTIGFYNGAGALWSGEQSEEMTVSFGFFIFFTIIPEFIKTILNLFMTWQMLLWCLFVMVVAVLIYKFASPSVNDRFLHITQGKHIWYILVFSGLIWMVLYAHQIGKEQAITDIEKLLTSGCVANKFGWNHCHQVWLKDKLIHEGYLISKSTNGVVMFKRDLKALEYIKLPKDAILRRHFQLPEEKDDSDKNKETSPKN